MYFCRTNGTLFHGSKMKSNYGMLMIPKNGWTHGFTQSVQALQLTLTSLES